MANRIINVSGDDPYFELLSSAARTETPDTVEVVVDRRGFNPRGLILTIDATAVTSVPALTLSVYRVDKVSGKAALILASAAIATVSTTTLKIGPNLAAVAGLVALDYVPPVFRIDAVHGNANSITYSVGGMLV